MTTLWLPCLCDNRFHLNKTREAYNTHLQRGKEMGLGETTQPEPVHRSVYSQKTTYMTLKDSDGECNSAKSKCGPKLYSETFRSRHCLWDECARRGDSSTISRLPSPPSHRSGARQGCQDVCLQTYQEGKSVQTWSESRSQKVEHHSRKLEVETTFCTWCEISHKNKTDRGVQCVGFFSLCRMSEVQTWFSYQSRIQCAPWVIPLGRRSTVD